MNWNIMNLLLYFQVFNETVARDSYAGVKKWYSSARHDYWSWCGYEHAFKIRQNDHQKQRSSQFGDAQCTRKQYQVCSVPSFFLFLWKEMFRRLIMIFTSFGHLFSFQTINAKLPLQPLTFMASKGLFPITKELNVLFCWSDFWYQKFSAPEDHLGSIQKFLKIQIYKDSGCWPFCGYKIQCAPMQGLSFFLFSMAYAI